MKKSIVRILAALTVVSAAQLPAATVVTRFNTDPFAAGWQAFGTTNLFTWDDTNANLRVTWDSAQPNSFFALPLGQTLSRTNDFLVRFDLNLADFAIGTTPEKPFTFQLSVSLLNLAQATNASYIRGSGTESPNLVDWNFFPDSGFGAGVSTPMVSATTNWLYTWNAIDLATNVTYGIQLTYTAADQTLRGTMTSNGIPLGPLQTATVDGAFGDFAVDTLAVSSFSDNGQDPMFGGSILAHGTVDNVVISTALPVSLLALPAPGQVSFASDTNWVYTLEATTDFTMWSAATPATAGNGSTLTLQDTNPPAAAAFYRVSAALP